MVQAVIKAGPDSILSEMKLADYGEHNLLVYPHLPMLRDIYSRYSKSQLEKGKGNIVLLPTYENVNSVRNTLTENGLDVSRFEEDESLVILDSVKGYFESNPHILSRIEMLAKRADSENRDGCSVISDMGSFNLLRKEQELLEYETSLPLRFNSIKCKAFCCYHQANFDRLSESEKKQLFEHHDKNLIMTKSN